MPEFPRLEI
jgi:hypothetical protein